MHSIEAQLLRALRHKERKTMEFWVEVIAATDAAVLVEIEGSEEWIPRSQIEDGDEWEKGDKGDITISEWLCVQRGWLD